MSRVSAHELLRIKSQELGLNPELNPLESKEGIACTLRRAAGYLSPCSAGTLVREVVYPVEGLVSDLQGFREKVEDVLESLVAHGDLLEQIDIGDPPGGERASSLLYAAPPSFVVRRTGSVVLLGIAPDHPTPVPSELEARVEYIGHVRRIRESSSTSVRTLLLNSGLIELPIDYWLKCPLPTSAEHHLAGATERLSRAPAIYSDVPGLTILDSDLPVRYYRGRWKEPKKHTGRFVGRRKQAYGADLWCYVELIDGKPQRFVDLPFGRDRHRACDAAWHLQMAVDAIGGHPQFFSTDALDDNNKLLKLYSPIPQWASRRLEAIGSPVETKGCLISYEITATELDEELSFLRSALWLSEEARI